MNTITLTKDQVSDILDGKYVKGETEKHYRHNGSYNDVIFKKEGKFYRFTYLFMEDEGICWNDTYTATEVVESERVEKYWKVVE